MKILTNDSGIFEIDEEGLLCSFESKISDEFLLWNNKIDIPEGVVAIPKGIFNGLVTPELKIPSSTKEIREFAFAEMEISRIEFGTGANWMMIDKTAFWLSFIGEIKTAEVDNRIWKFDEAREYTVGFSAYDKNSFVNDLLENADVIQNESGIFFLDSMGMLVAYKLFLEQDDKRKGKKVIKNLIIPEGVTVIRDDDFRSISVLEKFELPSSLRLIGTRSGCAFSHCEFNEVIFPENVRLGFFAFGNSKIGSLTIDSSFRPVLRQLKDCRIKVVNLRVRDENEKVDGFCLDANVEEIRKIL